jgi:hypothetical protein
MWFSSWDGNGRPRDLPAGDAFAARCENEQRSMVERGEAGVAAADLGDDLRLAPFVAIAVSGKMNAAAERRRVE